LPFEAARVTQHIGLVGCGNWGRLILRDLKALGCRVSVVSNCPSSRLNAEDFGADRILHSSDEFDDSIHGFVVATPIVSHAEAIFALLRFQKPVFVEKPLTNSPELARALVDAAADRLFVMDKWRYHPGIEALREIAVSGELGPVESIRTARLGWSNSQQDVDSLWVLLPHDLSIVLEILGCIPDPECAIPEYSDSRLTGLVGLLGGSPRVIVAVSEKSVDTIRSVAVNFRYGAALLADSYSACIKLRRAPGGRPASDNPIEIRPVSNELPLLRELKTFLTYLRGGPPPKTSSSEGLRVVEVIADLRSRANLQG
jgi:predicted dehydrogenase